jgi:hypothetical protein
MRASRRSVPRFAFRTSLDHAGDPRRDARFARNEREPGDAPARRRQLLEPQPGAGGHHRRPACAHRGDDLLRIDPLQVDRGRAEVGVPELALDDVAARPRGRARARARDVAGAARTGAARLALAATCRISLRTAAPDHGLPRVGPSMLQNSGPAGSSRARGHPGPQSRSRSLPMRSWSSSWALARLAAQWRAPGCRARLSAGWFGERRWELRARRDAEFAVGAGEVHLDRLRCDEEGLCDLAVGGALGRHLGDAPLARCE